MWNFLIATCALLIITIIFYAIGAKNYNAKITKTTSIQLNIIDTNQIIASEQLVNKKKIKHHVPKFMLDLYQRNGNGSFFGDSQMVRADIVRSVIPKNAGYKLDYSENLYDNTHYLLFNIPLANEDEEFRSAELKLFTIIREEVKERKDAERIINISILDEKINKLIYQEKIHVDHKTNKWISFNITSPILKLIKNKPFNSEEIFIRVEITIQSYRDNFQISLMPLSEDLEHDYPILLLAYDSINAALKRRRKRNLFEEDYEEETNNVWDDDNQRKMARELKRAKNSCKRRPLYVEFAEINYDSWIVQPSGYEAFQCQGKCFYPVADHLSPTKHAIVQALVHSVSPSKASRSCCVPTKLDSISVLYVDGRGVLTYRFAYKDMVVLECGCR